mgnify:FL=1
MLIIGENSPNFNLPSNGGGTLSLDDFKGRNLVLFFYPKDDTSGCTKEAIEFSQKMDMFANANTAIVGVSKDTVIKHDKFISKHDLKTPLISDTTGQMCVDYGVWKEKKLYGRTYLGIVRTTFLIDTTGIIHKIWPNVRVKGHVDEVYEAVQSL